jgi:Cu+-exporting ATPase
MELNMSLKHLSILTTLAVAFLSTQIMADSAAFKVDGMTCGGCEGKVKKALAQLDGVSVQTVSHKDGMARVEFDAAKSSKQDILKAIDGTGFKAVGEELSFTVNGMTCGACEGKVKKALAKLDGVEVQSVSSKENKAVVVVDTAKTSEENVAAAIKSTGFSIQ